MTTNVAVRLNMEGGAEFQREARAAGDALAGAYERAASAADRAAAREIERNRISAAAAREKQSMLDANARFDTVLGVNRGGGPSARQSAEVFEAFARAEDQAAEKARQLKAAIDPLWAAEQRLANETRVADDLLKRKMITTREHAAALGQAKQRYDQVDAAQKAMARSGGLAAHEMTNLSYQLNDVVVSLASGQNPMMVFMQQGAQIGQIVGNRPGGLTSFMRGLAASIPPTVALLGGAAVVIGVLAKSSYDYAESNRAVEASAAGVGRMAGATGRELRELADASAEAGGRSQSAARQMAVEWASTGKISAAVIGDLIASQRDYAVATGRDSAEATKALGDAMADPVAGAARLNAELGFLNATQMEHIRLLVQQGDKTGAQKYLADQLRGSIAGMADQYGGLAEQLGVVARAASDAWTWLAKVQEFQQRPLGPMPWERAAQEAAAQQQAGAGAMARLNTASTSADDLARRLFPDGREALREQQSTLARGVMASSSTGQVEALQRQAGAYNAVTRALETYMAPAEKAHKLAELELQISNAKDPARRAELAGQRERVRLAGEVVSAAEVEQRATDAANTARAAATRSGASHSESLARQSNALEVNARETLALAQAYLASDAAALKAEARRKALTEATRRGADVEEQARRQLQLTVAEQVAQAAKSVAELRGQAEVQRTVNEQVAAGTVAANDASRALQVETALRPVLTAQLVAEGATRDQVTAIIQRMRDAYADLAREQARSQAIAASAAANDNVSLLNEELRLLTASNEERAVALARKRAELDLARDGLKADDPEYAKRISSAEAEARKGAELDRGRYAERARRDQRDQLELLEAEIGLVGKGQRQRDEEMARLRTMQALREQGIDVLSREGQAILDNEAKIRAQTRALEQQRAPWDVLIGASTDLLDGSVELFRRGETGWAAWRDLGLQAIRDVIAEMFKLAAINPLKNALFGQDNPTLGSGGLFSLFSGGGGSSNILPGDTPMTLPGHPLGGAKSIFSSIFGGLKIPGFASGTNSAPGGLSYVHSDELIDVPKGSRIIPSHALRAAAAMRGGGDGVSVSLDIQVDARGAGPSEVEAIRAELAELKRTLPGTIVRTVSDARERRWLGAA